MWSKKGDGQNGEERSREFLYPLTELWAAVGVKHWVCSHRGSTW